MSLYNYQKFVSALYEAHSASESVDLFDLRSNQESKKQFNGLLVDQYEAFRQLIQTAKTIDLEQDLLKSTILLIHDGKVPMP